MSASNPYSKDRKKRELSSPDTDSSISEKKHKEDTMDALQTLTADEKLNKVIEMLFEVKTEQKTANGNADEALKEIKSLKLETTGIKNRLSKIESRVDKLETETQANKLNILEQNQLTNYCCLIGFPEINKEVLPSIIEKLSTKCKYPINTINDLKELYIKKNKINGATIVMKFYDERDKINLKNAFDKSKPVTVEELVNLPEPSVYRGKEIYIKDRLSAANLRLKNECKKSLNTKFNYVWDKNGKVFVRQNNETPTIHVKSTEHLESIIKAIDDSKVANKPVKNNPQQPNGAPKSSTFNLQQSKFTTPTTRQNTRF